MSVVNPAHLVKAINLYPTIRNFKELAGLVKEVVGDQVKLTYSANWGEYHNPYMDQLWCDSNIDWVGISAYFPLTDNLPQEQITFDKIKRVGISAYFPLTDNLPQEQITFDKIKKGWSSGEGIDFYKDGDIKVNFDDQAWAWKNVRYWWDSFHPDNTCWTPKQKPIIFTEYEFSSIDGTSNHPYLYYDANSNHENSPQSNNEAQSLAIAASETFFSESNNQDRNFLPWCFLYAWDARPYPAFPNDCNYWSDCNQYPFSHSVNGKIGTIMIETAENIGNSEL